ncbi:MAG: GntR family transcriptional regulator [Gammaproteobacteria bacterium]|nr:GntR family transcriptional regulator [Gammaproteobacteria bacterium]MBU1443535.1 GntR family transcriptional regulator [Gammaproteobacteria bacterium]MBU2286689.1 GntR family transcriptional regulator [Gammaproteobacteria bacterium]
MASSIKTGGKQKAALPKRELGVDEIVENISNAILEHRLVPGTKLGEDRLAAIYGTNRPRIREVLARLSHEQVVELVPQRGAFVAKPTVEQARDVFETRRLVEPGVLERLTQNLDDDKLRRLVEHLEREEKARRAQDKHAVVRLSGEFHTLLAELAGNSVLARCMKELSTLTCLTISLYDAPTANSCRVDEHSAIVDAIRARNLPLARNVMLQHLQHIEDSLNLNSESEGVDLESVLG